MTVVLRLLRLDDRRALAEWRGVPSRWTVQCVRGPSGSEAGLHQVKDQAASGSSVMKGSSDAWETVRGNAPELPPSGHLAAARHQPPDLAGIRSRDYPPRPPSPAVCLLLVNDIMPAMR